MREGMKGKVGIGKVALYGREYLVAIKVQQHGLVMYTLHHAAEIRTIDQIEELETVPRTVKPQELKLAKQVVEMFDGELDLKDYKDEYKEELRRIIDARVAGEEYVASEVEEPPTNVVDLMAALRKSLDAASAAKKKPATAALPVKKAVAKAEPKRKRA
jgi:DNA end-binding protein Ku